MATRLWFEANTAAPVSPGFDAGWQATTGAVRRNLTRAKAAATETRAGVAVTSGANNETLGFQLISEPLAAQTISGTVTLMTRGRELANNDNIDRRALSIRVVSNDGSTFRTPALVAQGFAADIGELDTVLTGYRAANATSLSAVTAQAGDRLVVEVGYGMSATGTTPAYDMVVGGSGTDHANADGDTSGTVPWVEFSQDIAFQSAPLAAVGSSISGGTATLSFAMALTAAGQTSSGGTATLTLPFTRANSLEGGSNGTTITTGNSGGASGDAFDAFEGTAPTYTTSGPLKGSVSASSAAGASGSAAAVWFWGSGGSQSYQRAYYRAPSPLPSGNTYLLQSTGSGNGLGAQAYLNASGQFVITNAADTPLATSTLTVAAGDPFRLELRHLAAGASGAVELRIFVGADLDGPAATPTETLGPVTTDASTVVGQQRCGITFAGAATTVVWDDWAVSDTTWLGPTAPAGGLALTAAGSTSSGGTASLLVTVTAAVEVGAIRWEVVAAGALTASGQTVSGGTAAVALAVPLAASGQTTSGGSATLALAAAIQAAGVTTSGGVAVLSVAVPIAASGSTISSGQATISGQGTLQAVGQTTSQGAATLSLALAIAASGTTTSQGTVALAIVVPITASGLTASSGLATMSGQAALQASGTTTSQGAATLALARPLQAAGPTVSGGVVQVAGALALAATGSTVSSGTVAVTRLLVASGATVSGGSAALGRLLAAAGVTSSGGSAALALLLPIAASGQTASAGVAVLALARPLAASGLTSSAGAATLLTFFGIVPEWRGRVGISRVGRGPATTVRSGPTGVRGG